MDSDFVLLIAKKLLRTNSSKVKVSYVDVCLLKTKLILYCLLNSINVE